jgi:hypothetical protein
VVKIIIMAVSAAALIATTAIAQSASATTPAQRHKSSTRHHSALGAPYQRGMQAAPMGVRYPDAYGYAPIQSEPIDRDLAASRQAGG